MVLCLSIYFSVGFCNADDGWITITSQGFEGSFPAGDWYAFGLDPFEITWGKDDYKPYSGNYSAWCAASHFDAETDDYPNYMIGLMGYGPFDLSDAVNAKLTFYYWNESQPTYDTLICAVAIDSLDIDNIYPCFFPFISGDSGGWVHKEVDLTKIPVLGSVCGEESVYIGFVFMTNEETTDKGAFVDDITLQKQIAMPGIDIEKYTNGEDADSEPGPSIPSGNAVSWNYVVTNTGNVTLTDITVTDDQGVTVTCPKDTLEAGESMTCTGSGVAEAGQYANMGTVTGEYNGETYTDTDPSHYFGAAPGIDIEKHTNDIDADTPPGPPIFAGSTVTWKYIVTNNSNVTMTDIEVTDDQIGEIDCPKYTLTPGESMICIATGTAIEGQYSNIATVTCEYNGETYSDSDTSHYYGENLTWDMAYQNLFDDPDNLYLLRRYRDEFLKKTPQGREYASIIYNNSGKTLQVLMDNPDLMLKAKKLISENMEAVTSILSGGEGEIKNTEDIISFLDAYAAKSPPTVKKLVSIVKIKMQRKQRLGKTFFGFKLK
jgi:hypothetical protein